VALEGEDERDVDRPAGGDRVLDRAEPRDRRRDLDEQVRTIDERGEELGLREGRVALVREIGIDLERDEAVDAGCAVPHRPEKIAGALDVLDRECEEDLARVVGALELGAKLLVVPVPGGHGLLEDGRIRRDPDDGVLVDHARELAVLEHLA
jgi:hypothetical protein